MLLGDRLRNSGYLYFLYGFRSFSWSPDSDFSIKNKHSLETFPCLLHSSDKTNCFIIVIFLFLFTKLLSQPSSQKNKLLAGAMK